ncbi:hypothetical protein BJ875DRAFT_505772 [Amylocarpus encephaloides]|uniref:Protein HRI1 n=1 Tax=Amylocarpus encephaloides TaxID=45428 RepID=A0A9P8C3P3_9HELO|nr:hypothetical protein BJ875DRAFT_505772 [Amylocarpus encephaloides]
MGSNTLVLTSAGKSFVDTRIYLPKSSTDPSLPCKEVLPISRLEWGFAGTAQSTPAIHNTSTGTLEKPSHTEWTHWVDSKTMDEVKDEGDMFPKEDGSNEVLERGAMVNPATGQVEDYQEFWVDIEPTKLEGEEERRSWVLKTVTEDDEGRVVRGMIVRIGEYIEGVLRVGEDVGVRRWQWKGSNWEETLRIGRLEEPFDGKEMGTLVEVGHEVNGKDGIVWKYVEEFSWK